ncbi:MAG: ImuA family protein [Stellaceae bacterium]
MVQQPELAALKARLALAAGGVPAGLLPLGALPALPRAGLHEIEGDGAASGFAAALAGLLASGRGRVLWCTPLAARREIGTLYGAGLAACGLDPARLIVASPRQTRDALWTMEEALRGGVFAAVIGEIETLPPIAARRLQLAAEAHATAALLLLPSRTRGVGVGMTRWRATSAPGGGWHIELARCRGGASGTWLVEWNHATHRFDLVAVSGERPGAPVARRLDRPARGADRRAGEAPVRRRT